MLEKEWMTFLFSHKMWCYKITVKWRFSQRTNMLAQRGYRGGSGIGWIKSAIFPCAVLTESCPTLCDPPDCSSPQAPLSEEFFRQEYWSGLTFPPPGDLPDPGIKHTWPAVADRFFTTESPGTPFVYVPGLHIWSSNLFAISISFIILKSLQVPVLILLTEI